MRCNISISFDCYGFSSYQSIALATSSSRQYIASACKALSPEHAVVRIHDTTTYQPVGEPLTGHSLTVTQIAFSPDDQLILTVSRDRSWRLYQKVEGGGDQVDHFLLVYAHRILRLYTYGP